MHHRAFPKWYDSELNKKECVRNLLHYYLINTIYRIQKTLSFPVAPKKELVTRDDLIKRIAKFIICDNQVNKLFAHIILMLDEPV